MRKFVLLAMVIIAAVIAPARAQQDLYWMYHSPTPLPLPEATLDAAELIDVLSEYSLKHQERIIGGEYSAMVEPWYKVIWISDQGDQTIRRAAVIHEFLHVYYFRHYNLRTGGFPAGETAVELEAQRLYDLMFTKDQGAFKQRYRAIMPQTPTPTEEP